MPPKNCYCIIARKQQELKNAGVSFWGYGGNTCHPTTKVQPFVSKLAAHGQEVYPSLKGASRNSCGVKNNANASQTC